MVHIIFLAIAVASSALALDNGVGRLPKMGFDTFNAFVCDYDQAKVLSTARAMKNTGLLDAGYNSILLDDCMTTRNRSGTGKLVADSTKFPGGLKNFTSTIKALGFSSSAYSDNGYATCAGYAAAYGHEESDLEQYYDWGFNYLKYDNCYIPFDSITQENMYGRFKRMSDAIAKVAARRNEKPMELSLSIWGWQQPWIWGPRISQSWRINGDIKPWWSSIAAIIDQASFNWWASNFYGHNDMDMLEVGNTGQGNPVGNLTYEEAKTHFTAWALLKSPLIIGTDLRNATNQTISILGNKDILKINQDPNVGESVSPFRWGINPDYTSNKTHPAEYWSGNSSYGVVFMTINSQDTPQEMFFNLTESWAIRAGRQYSVYDMWTHSNVGMAVRNITLKLPAHGVSALLLTDAGPEPEGLFPYCGFYWQCAFPNVTYSTN